MAKSKTVTTNVHAASHVGRDRKNKPSARSSGMENFKAMSLRQLRRMGHAAAQRVVGNADAKRNAHRDVIAAGFVTPEDPRELEFLTICQRIYWENRGCGTPFEELACALVKSASHYAPASTP